MATSIKSGIYVQETASKHITSIKKELSKLPIEAFKYFVKQTPIDKGHARKSTHLNKNIIHANYPYAGALDNGHSKQAPRGMVKPTQEFVHRRVDEITKGKV